MRDSIAVLTSNARDAQAALAGSSARPSLDMTKEKQDLVNAFSGVLIRTDAGKYHTTSGVVVRKDKSDFALSLDSSSGTATKVAKAEWLDNNVNGFLPHFFSTSLQKPANQLYFGSRLAVIRPTGDYEFDEVSVQFGNLEPNLSKLADLLAEVTYADGSRPTFMTWTKQNAAAPLPTTTCTDLALSDMGDPAAGCTLLMGAVGVRPPAAGILHAQQAGDFLAALGGDPSQRISIGTYLAGLDAAALAAALAPVSAAIEAARSAHGAALNSAASAAANSLLDAGPAIVALQSRELLLGDQLRTELSRHSALVIPAPEPPVSPPQGPLLAVPHGSPNTLSLIADLQRQIAAANPPSTPVFSAGGSGTARRTATPPPPSPAVRSPAATGQAGLLKALGTAPTTAPPPASPALPSPAHSSLVSAYMPVAADTMQTDQIFIQLGGQPVRIALARYANVTAADLALDDAVLGGSDTADAACLSLGHMSDVETIIKDRGGPSPRPAARPLDWRAAKMNLVQLGRAAAAVANLHPSCASPVSTPAPPAGSAPAASPGGPVPAPPPRPFTSSVTSATPRGELPASSQKAAEGVAAESPLAFSPSAIGPLLLPEVQGAELAFPTLADQREQTRAVCNLERLGTPAAIYVISSGYSTHKLSAEFVSRSTHDARLDAWYLTKDAVHDIVHKTRVAQVHCALLISAVG